MKICIEHIPWHTNANDLRMLCKPFGIVFSSSVKIDEDTLRTRGYGEVGMAEDNCNHAIKRLNGMSYYSCRLKAQIACE